MDGEKKGKTRKEIHSVAEVERLIICRRDRKATDQKVKHSLGELPKLYVEANGPDGTPGSLLQSL